MNAHTSNYADFVINDSDFIDVLPLDYIVDEPMHIQRQSQDKFRQIKQSWHYVIKYV